MSSWAADEVLEHVGPTPFSLELKAAAAAYQEAVVVAERLKERRDMLVVQGRLEHGHSHSVLAVYASVSRSRVMAILSEAAQPSP